MGICWLLLYVHYRQRAHVCLSKMAKLERCNFVYFSQIQRGYFSLFTDTKMHELGACIINGFGRSEQIQA